MKKYCFIILAVVSVFVITASCSGNKASEQNPEEIEDSLMSENAFSADALPDLVSYQQQKSSEEGVGEYNPFESYGFKEMVSPDDVTDEDYEYADEQVEEVLDEGQFEEASENYQSQPVTYYLGHNVEFKLKNNDLSDFKKKADDAVAVIDRFDDNAKQMDILIYDKKLYDEFRKESNEQKYSQQGENLFIAKADSIGVDVAVNFVGPCNGGYLISIYNK